MTSTWICCQLGAREHYSFARALHTKGILEALVTDAWVPPNGLLGRLRLPLLTGLRERFHPDLASAAVKHFTFSLLVAESVWRGTMTDRWRRSMARNQWFQRHSLCFLKRFALRSRGRPVLFTYSYSSLELLRFAKQQGWTTVMSQIDGGVRDERIVERAHRSRPELRPRWKPAPSEYWRLWREECVLTDKIVVNSDWSRGLLEEAGVQPSKLHVIPVAFDPAVRSGDFRRSYPTDFNNSRPLRVLFLGAFAVRKGAAAVLDAIELLWEEPIEFSIVGSVDIEVPAKFRETPKVRWIGSVSRKSTAEHYRNCDVFLFPTMSDGFGMTQVEARAWKLPIIATSFCAPIVQHGRNGLVIPELTGSHLADAIRELLYDPKRLQCLADGTTNEYRMYSPDRVRDQILALGA